MEQTAVEWLEEQISILEIGVSPQWLINAIKKAKEIEKRRLYNFYVQGGIDCITEADRTVEDYYNATFKKK